MSLSDDSFPLSLFLDAWCNRTLHYPQRQFSQRHHLSDNFCTYASFPHSLLDDHLRRPLCTLLLGTHPFTPSTVSPSTFAIYLYTIFSYYPSFCHHLSFIASLTHHLSPCSCCNFINIFRT